MSNVILRVLSAFFLFASFFPLLKWDYWWVRIFDYPRLQKLSIIILLIIGWIFIPGNTQQEVIIWIGCLSISAIYLITKVWPFTPLGRKMIETVPYNEEAGINILVANVYQYNKEFGKLIDLVKSIKPDLAFFVETDKAWEKGLSEIENDYPTQIKIPKDNTYGLILYTRMEITRQEINYLIDEEVPSLEIDLKLRNGEIITIYAIHPTPPVPSENDKSTERDAEILLVGQRSKENKKPSLVIGDLNDVAWSYTTELFLKNSEMVDHRRGRGLFNTFHAKVPLFRWPLDHIFLSKHFGLASLKVQKGIGSDHFPISIKAVLTPSDDTEMLEADGDEKEEAREKISRGLHEE